MFGPTAGGKTRSINVYTNAPAVQLLVNGKPASGGDAQSVPFFGMATFDKVEYADGECLDPKMYLLSWLSAFRDSTRFLAHAVVHLCSE